MGLFSLRKKEPKPIGEVIHYFGDLSVAVVRFGQSFKIGGKARFKGATTDFEQVIQSMQCDHKAVENAKKGQELGIKVKGKVRQGDQVFAA